MKNKIMQFLLALRRRLTPVRVTVETYNTFYHLVGEHQVLATTLVGRLLRMRMYWWWAVNRAGHEKMSNLLHEIDRQYFEFDEAGLMKSTKPSPFLNREGKRDEFKPKPILLNGQTMAGYQAAWDAFMAQPCNVCWPMF